MGRECGERKGHRSKSTDEKSTRHMKTSVSKRRSHIQKGVVRQMTAPRLALLKIHPISPLSALLVITSLSCDGGKDYFGSTVI